MEEEHEFSDVKLAILLSLDREQLIAIVIGYFTEGLHTLPNETLIVMVKTACEARETDVLTRMYSGQQLWKEN